MLQVSVKIKIEEINMPDLLRPDVLEDQIKDLVRDIYLAFHKNSSHFNAYLLRLIHKADPSNRARLRFSFQMEVTVYEMWYNSPNEDAFFRKYLGDNYKERYADG